MTGRARIERVLDRARWAPSGDNTQPWRFQIISDDHAVVLGSDTRRTVVYDLRGHASQIAVGALLEHVAIAASGEGLRVTLSRRPSSGGSENEEHPVFDVRFSADPGLAPDPLSPFLETRTVNRRPFGTVPLTFCEKKELEARLPEGYRIQWLEGWKSRFAMADLNQRSGKLRLTIPEGYAVHREIIEWNARTSEDRVPDRALGLSPFILPLIRWIMGRWERVAFFNCFLGGTLIPRLQLDILPALFCSSHFLLLAPAPPRTLDDYVAGGRALARFWLGCAARGIQFQPEMTPLIFSSYVREGIRFSTAPHAPRLAEEIARRLSRLGGEATDRAVFLGRVGRGAFPSSRSLRKPLPVLTDEGQNERNPSDDASGKA